MSPAIHPSAEMFTLACLEFFWWQVFNLFSSSDTIPINNNLIHSGVIYIIGRILHAYASSVAKNTFSIFDLEKITFESLRIKKF